ncbi:hypothetical protein GCM10012276_18620 [Nocardioides deserti]|nr:hypothetical protein GCM10012276_18620 [Nocardioides deserti]
MPPPTNAKMRNSSQTPRRLVGRTRRVHVVVATYGFSLAIVRAAALSEGAGAREATATAAIAAPGTANEQKVVTIGSRSSTR